MRSDTESRSGMPLRPGAGRFSAPLHSLGGSHGPGRSSLWTAHPTSPEDGSFDRLAPFYRGLEAVLAANLLQRCRVAWIDEARRARRILVAGPGAGRFLSAAVERLPEASFLCVDSSAGMLRQCARRVRAVNGADSRVTWVHASLPGWKPPAERFDVLVTHFFLDCFPKPELDDVIETLAGAATPNAAWLISDFQVPAARWSALRARLILWVAYRFFRATTGLRASRLHSPVGSLQREGFHRTHRRTFSAGLLTSEVWQRNPASDSPREPCAPTTSAMCGR